MVQHPTDAGVVEQIGIITENNIYIFSGVVRFDVEIKETEGLGRKRNARLGQLQPAAGIPQSERQLNERRTAEIGPQLQFPDEGP
jgi:hypothetical protein